MSPDSFEYAVTVCPPYGYFSKPAEVTISVVAVNDRPVALSFVLNATENRGSHFTLLSQDVDEGDVTVYLITSLPTRGKLFRADFDESVTVGKEYAIFFSCIF